LLASLFGYSGPHVPFGFFGGLLGPAIGVGWIVMLAYCHRVTYFVDLRSAGMYRALSVFNVLQLLPSRSSIIS